MSSEATPTPSTPTKPTRSGRLLSLVAALIDYGRQLLATFQQHRSAACGIITTSAFYTADVPHILLRITRGLLRAEALLARLTEQAAHLDAPRRPKPARTAAPRPATPRKPPCTTIDPDPIRLPTGEEVVAEVRSQPIGAVIVSICCDLGIVLCHPLLHRLLQAVMGHGGSHRRFMNYTLNRPWVGFDPADTHPPPVPSG